MWSPGDVVLGVYEVRDVVTTGGMGLVYRVWHRQWGMELAVKTPRPELVASPADVERFEAEAETWVGLGAHPHVVSCAYVRRVDGTPRVFAEWAGGGSLADAVRDRALYAGGHRPAVRRILDLAIQTAWGLGHAHARGVVHQDVKPANVMLDTGGAAKVTDFGLANVAGGEGMTLEYCSPEQARGEHLGPATDVWSWAVSVVEMFAGGPPAMFGHAAAGVFAQFIEAGPADPVLPPVPRGVADLLRRCFAEDPAARPAGFGELADELAELYRATVFEPYPRQRPDEAPLLADALSNRALSLLDLGHAEQADELWDEALRADPHHPHATYNRGLRRWRAGAQTDRQLLAELEAVRLSHDGDRTADHLLAAVHIERGDKESALRLLADLPDGPDTAARALPDRKVTERPGPVFVNLSAPLALSADGQVAAVTFRQREAEVWGLPEGRVRYSLAGHENRLRSMSLSADGRVLASADDGGQVRVWDTTTGECTRVVDVPGGVEAVAISPDGTVVAVVSGDGSVRVLGETVELLRAGSPDSEYGRGWAIAVTEDNERVVAFDGFDWSLRVLTRAGEELWRVGGLRHNCALSPTARYALSATHDDNVVLVDLTTAEVTVIGSALLWNKGFSWLAVSDDGRTAVNTFDLLLQHWRLDEGRCTFTTTVHARDPMTVAADADGRTVLTLLGSRTPQTVHTTAVVHLPEPGPAAPWSYARPQPTDRMAGDALIAAENLGLAAEYLDTGRLADARRQLDILRAMPAYRRHPELRILWRRVGAVSERIALAGVWPSRRFDDVLHGHTALTRNVHYAFADFFNRAAFRIVDLRTGDVVAAPDGHELDFSDVTACADDRHVLAVDSDGAEVLWDLRTARRAGVVVRDDAGNPVLKDENPAFEFVRRELSILRNRLTGRPLHGWSARADERVVLSGSVAVLVKDDGAALVLDADQGKLVRTARVYAGGPSVVASADGRVLVATKPGFDNIGEVVLSVAGSAEAVAKVADDRVVSLALSADGDLLLTASPRLLRLWHLPSGGLVTEIECDQDVIDVELSADGCAAVAVLAYRHLQCWELDWDYRSPVPS
ncbi:serine/threonine protein kinase/WD40 repeat protein [Amycolatopsis lexingtonensis]|uniref:Serine/threonine protein kinase/WD40 repeat protein n=2 Tax=Amycolatopsis lexingtonensis TaxID=218822 RepID=A0ABR9HRA7_9PSEU|nr:protein kinase [Amycolatopsis lexingtonensis]MBE1493468.1 serine/threonine protein kinase/WD40 repeat protein [Amycolatopsis lexingtonensis]